MRTDWIDYLQGYCRNCRYNKGCRYKSKSFENLCFVHKPKKKKKATSKPFFESPVIKKIMKDQKRRKSINEKTKIYEAAAIRMQRKPLTLKVETHRGRGRKIQRTTYTSCRLESMKMGNVPGVEITGGKGVVKITKGEEARTVVRRKKKLSWWENFLCNIMDIHDVKKTYHDGASQHGICKRCNKKGMFDSQGGFF